MGLFPWTGLFATMNETATDLIESPQARVIAVTSGKGGVGKTNIAVNLSIALASMGRKVILWDLDFGLANVDVLLNLGLKHDLGDVLRGAMSIDDITVNGPGHIRVVPGASGDEQLANMGSKERRVLLQAIEKMSGEADYIILDTGAGIAANTIQFTTAADDVLVVTTPEPTAMLDAYATIKVVHGTTPASRIHLLVNMARDRKEARQAMLRMATIAEHFLSSHLLEDGYMLLDQNVAQAVRKRRPFILISPECQPARALHMISHAIDHIAGGHGVHPTTRSGFLERLIEQFGLT